MSSEDPMSKRSYLFAAALTVLYLSVAGAQQYPIADKVAEKIIQKYQTSTCEQLYQQKAEKGQKQPSAAEQKVVQLLHQDPQMRTAFINKVAAPIANKMFECGMIP
jgi:hypothetical protein